jgi:hypothetical protein
VTDKYVVAAYNSCARTRAGATDRPGPASEVVFRGEQPLQVEPGVAQAWKDAQTAMDALQSLSNAFEEALTSLQDATKWTAEVSKGWSSCLVVIARVLHKEDDEVKWLMLSLLDEHSRNIVQVLLSTMDRSTGSLPGS